MAVAAAAVEGLAGGEGAGMLGGGATSMGNVASIGVRIQGDFKGYMKGLDEMSKKSQTKGKEASKGIDQLMKSVDNIKKTTAFLAFVKGMELVVGAINFMIDHSQVLQTVLGAVDDIFSGLVDIFLSAFLPAILPIITAFAKLIPVVSEVVNEFRPIAEEIGKRLIKFFDDNKDSIDKVVAAIVDLIGTGLITFLGVLSGMLPIINPLIKLMAYLFTEAEPVIKTIVELLASLGATGIIMILTLILTAINLLLAPLAALRMAWDFISNAIKTFIGWVKAGINILVNFADTAKNTLGNIGGGILSGLQGFGNMFSGGLFQMGNIPHFQSGGVVTSPTLATVGEVPEMIIPFSKMSRLADSASSSSANTYNIQINVPNVHIGSPDPKTIRQFVDMVEMEMRKRINMGLVSTLR